MICKDGAEWKRRVTANGCQVHGDPRDCKGEPIQGHHILSQRKLKENGLGDHIWNTDVGMGACYNAHRRHHNRIQPIAYELLPDAAIRFAYEHGLDWLLDKDYPKATDGMEVPE